MKTQSSNFRNNYREWEASDDTFLMIQDDLLINRLYIIKEIAILFY